MSGRIKAHDFLSAAFFAAVCVFLYFLDLYPHNSDDAGFKCSARVLAVDNSRVEEIGILKKGCQSLKVEILEGDFKGEVFDARNILRAQMDFDKMFKVGDIAWVSILKGSDPKIDAVNAQDYYRKDLTIVLFSVFALLLAAFGGFVGFKALLSFALACLVIWKLVVPLCLMGYSAIWVSLFAVFVLTGAVLFLVAGFTRKGVTAFTGAMAGVLASCLMASVFTKLFSINGAVMPFSQALLYSGYEHLNLSELFIGGIFLSSSGAVMDLSMDVAAGMQEVYLRDKSISFKELVSAGFRMGRSVVGTMSTTLLLAYAGGYLTLMMAFLAQGTSPEDFINNPYVASECVKTIVGSFGLVLVAPLTAVAGGFFIRKF